MPRYIDADALMEQMIDACVGVMSGCKPFNEPLKVLESAPTADVVEIKKDGEWEMFDLISSAYYGKGMYFKQDGEIVYSRYSCKYMSVDEAIREFVSLIDDSNLP